MDPQSEISGSPTAWNGITLTMPDSWIPAAIEQRYLLFSRNSHPALEIKWHRVSDSDSLPKKEQSIIRQLKRMKGFSTDESAVTDQWCSITNTLQPLLEVQPFSHADGSGAICIHSPSKTILVLQVHAPIDQYDDVIRQILASLSITKTDEPVTFSMFGLRCALPAGSTLVRHSFKPGEFVLELQSGASNICITRLGPANVVLEGKPFRRWLHAKYHLPLENFRKDKSILPTGAKKRYHWEQVEAPSFMKRLFRSALGKPQQIKGAAWIVEEQNKLVTVEIRSNAPISSSFLESICNHVEVD
ncbi:hypothetical protein [Halodesulfovibrio spirochaetisodalis]|uniref:Uncharacterized protein n=1 Tax=Halodesulfovibrio spirochaetisodalis TaxID=1560234 RepID=A0A1B7XEM5_9BACT|nr:hypothetical protein [Halodesulfovibrio spirochaetisodalis]OBQ52634.1 hypothetical protein SP90_06565 [Halodesulfovibrio spirochaetisodalis]